MMDQVDTWPSEKRLPQVNAARTILSEIARYRRMTLAQMKAKPKSDMLAMIPHPSGRGSLLIGGRANKIFWLLSEMALAESDLRERLETARVVKHLQTELSNFFIRDGKPIDRTHVDQMMARAMAHAETACENITHYIPCYISADKEPSEFEIGPVSFTTADTFFDVHADEFRRYLSKREGADKEEKGAAEHKESLQAFVDDAKEWFDQFDYVATVTIQRCDPVISRLRAKRAVDTALDILRVMLRASHGAHVTMDSTPRLPLRSASIQRNSKYEIDITLHRSYSSRRLGKQWWAFLNSAENKARLIFAGNLIDAITSAQQQHPLCERLIDAMHWFGRGLTENFPGHRVLNYVTAIERTVLLPRETPTQTVSARVGIFCSEDGRSLDPNKQKEIRSIYGVRSDLLHGRASPFDVVMSKAAYDAEEAAWMTILRGLDFYQMIGPFNPKADMKILGKAFARLEEIAGVSHVLKRSRRARK
jgi:hypothetical protein